MQPDEKTFSISGKDVKITMPLPIGNWASYRFRNIGSDIIEIHEPAGNAPFYLAPDKSIITLDAPPCRECGNNLIDEEAQTGIAICFYCADQY